MVEMLESIWNWFLDLTSKLVIPDWGGLILLLPVGVMAVVIIWLIYTVRRLRGAPPARRGKMPVPPKTPAGIHMPGPSFAPVFAAVGSFLLFLGIVFPGPILWLGILALVLTLIYWLAEGVRLYEHRDERRDLRHLDARGKGLECLRATLAQPNIVQDGRQLVAQCAGKAALDLSLQREQEFEPRFDRQ